jgi:hypothetical protein
MLACELQAIGGCAAPLCAETCSRATTGPRMRLLGQVAGHRLWRSRVTCKFARGLLAVKHCKAVCHPGIVTGRQRA